MIDAVTITPALPLPAIGIGALVAGTLLAWTAVRHRRGVIWRTLALTVLFLALLDPKLQDEERVPRPDIALVVVDDSPSQRFADRHAISEAALSRLTQELASLDGVETRIVRAGVTADGAETRLFEAIDRAVSEDVAGRLGAVFLITDGQVHDTPDKAPAWLTAPLHALISGRPNEFDRRLAIEQVPAYGMVGSTVEARFRIDDLGPAAGTDGAGSPVPVTVQFSINGEPAGAIAALPGTTQSVSLPLGHAGPTVVEMSAEAAAGEIARVNNQAAVVINGVRDRLRVLLVSGQPHAGERVWRNLLKSDPAVDLVHFTILRPPEKDDATPLKELSLIVFPVQELFETKLNDFDLVLFDRYALRGVLPLPYYARIADYVRQGGALLLAVGPEYAGARSLYHTPLGEILPAAPTGRTFEQAFQPQISDVGRRHPVTTGLPGESAAGDADPGSGVADPAWGRWFRFVEAGLAGDATALLQAPGGRPLLVVDRVDKGRVGLLLSDQIWLWARGFEGGGPQGELLRRLAHWLMKEPDLEEESLTATVNDGRLVVLRRSLTPGDRAVTVTRPSAVSESLPLTGDDDGIARGELAIDEAGLWRVTDGERTALAAAGRINPREFAELRASDAVLAPLVATSRGGTVWLAGTDMPQLRRVAPDAAGAGTGWLGVARNGAYTVTGVRQLPLLPGLLILVLAGTFVAAAWWREGR